MRPRTDGDAAIVVDMTDKSDQVWSQDRQARLSKIRIWSAIMVVSLIARTDKAASCTSYVHVCEQRSVLRLPEPRWNCAYVLTLVMVSSFNVGIRRKRIGSCDATRTTTFAIQRN